MLGKFIGVQEASMELAIFQRATELMGILGRHFKT
jgi:hypothetical protein